MNAPPGECLSSEGAFVVDVHRWGFSKSARVLILVA